MIFWKPSGMPVNICLLRHGQHVEGHYKGRFDTMWKKIKHAEIRIKPYGDHDWTIMDILIPGTGGAIRMGTFYGKDGWSDDSNYSFKLYDGLRYTKTRRRRFP